MTAKRRAPRRVAAKKKTSAFRRAFKGGLVLGLVLVLLGGAAFAFLYTTTDLPDPNAEFKTQTTFVQYSDGSDLGRFAEQNRTVLGYRQIPEHMKNAVVAIENPTFWEDRGLDPQGIVRAAFNNATGGPTQGASTITQQYVKVLYLTQEQTYTRKLKEAVLSLKLHQQMGKRQVLAGYLNTIYFGRGAYGVQAASSAYFNRDAGDLNLRQSAALAAIVNNPTRFEPAGGKEARQALRGRYQTVLDRMAEHDYIPQRRAERLSNRLPKFPKPQMESRFGGQRGHMLTMVRKELNRLGFSDDEIDGSGLRVTTTFTKKAMRAAQQGVQEARPEGFAGGELHVGVGIVEPGSGAVRGIFGGQDYLQSQLNWAVAGGQAGSALKPFAVATGLKEGFALEDTFEGNSPYELPDGTEVENQGDRDYGTVDLIRATQDSINTAFIDLTTSIPDGPAKIIRTMTDMGIPPKKARPNKIHGFPNSTGGLDPGTGVALGSATVSPINLANAYATLANEGEYVEPYLIERVVDAHGETVYSHKPKTSQALDPDIAADTIHAMEQVVKAGSGRAALSLGRPVAGKTGTSTNSNGRVVSSWFGGFTPQLSAAVVYTRGTGVDPLDGWLPSFFGSDYPASTFTEVMLRAMEGMEIQSFPPPAWVDGEAPSEGHEPPPPPPPTPTTQPRPTQTQEPSPTQSEEPTPTQSEESTPTPTQSEEPSEPPATEPTCRPGFTLIGGDCESDEPEPTQEPTGEETTDGTGGGQGGGGGNSRVPYAWSYLVLPLLR